MIILALDIGAGTQDLLLYDHSKQSVENCIKMVLPSPSLIFAEKVREVTRLSQDLFVKGDTIGGGALSSAFKKHVKGGLRLVMTKRAAYTIRNDLQEVRELGIEVVSNQKPPQNFSGKTLKLQEVDLTGLNHFLASLNEDLSQVDAVAIAVQDHGVYPKGTSNRRFRIRKMRDLLEERGNPEDLMFREDGVPSYFLRMKASVQASKRQLPEAEAVVMDTSVAAVLGCLTSPSMAKSKASLVVNVGNGHTMAAIIAKGKIVGLMEHHTRLMNTQKMEQILIDFTDGKLTNEGVFNDNGHGLFFLSEPPGFSSIEEIIATGPNRKILTRSSLKVHTAVPAGDVMMTGPMGLVEAAKKKLSM